MTILLNFASLFDSVNPSSIDPCANQKFTTMNHLKEKLRFELKFQNYF